ncbi:hypothetical protein [Kineococcus arenarius]
MVGAVGGQLFSGESVSALNLGASAFSGQLGLQPGDLRQIG